MAEKEPLGFDAVAEPPEDQSSYTVEFASSDPPPEKKTDSGSEEIGLLDRQHGAMSPEDKVGWSGGVLACILPRPPGCMVVHFLATVRSLLSTIT